MGNAVFWQCGSLTAIEAQAFPLLKKMGDSVFYQCESLTAAYFPSLTTVGDEAFKGCGKLSSLGLSREVQLRGSQVFDGCDRLHTLAGTKKQEDVVAFFALTPLMRWCLSDGRVPSLLPSLTRGGDGDGGGQGDEDGDVVQKGDSGDGREEVGPKLAPAILTDYLRANPEAAGQRDRGGRTALSYYCEGGSPHEGTLRALLGAHPVAAGLPDRAGRCPLHHLCANPRATTEVLKSFVETAPKALSVLDRSGAFPLDLLPNESQGYSIWEFSVGDRSLGRSFGLHEKMMAALRQSTSKAVESAVEEFADQEDGDLLDLFAWQQFLELRHLREPAAFATELQLLFEATWSVLSHANARTDARSKALTANLTKAVERYVANNHNERPNLLPELITNVSMKKLQKLAATNLFRQLLDSEMRSGLIYIYYLEIVLFAIYLILFVVLSLRYKFASAPHDAWGDKHVRDMTVACLCFALYFFLREFAQLRAMHKLGLAKYWFKDGWNYIDLFASGGTIAMVSFFFVVGPGDEYDHFASVVSLFMWAKVLGVIKALSKPIATFVLLLSTIFTEVLFRAFLGVLLVIVVMFGHALYLTLANGEGHPYCVDPDKPDAILNFDSVPCTSRSLYLMVLGKLDEPDAFADSHFAGLLFVQYSFLVFIVLLNILIAIVGDSYDEALVKSNELFWRSRVELVAEISTTFKWILSLRRGGSDKPELNLKLNLKLDESNSDWTGRVLDIVRRVNVMTSSEAAKTNEAIEHLKKENNEAIGQLKKENAERKRENEELKFLLTSLMTSMKVPVPEFQPRAEKGQDEERREEEAKGRASRIESREAGDKYRQRGEDGRVEDEIERLQKEAEQDNVDSDSVGHEGGPSNSPGPSPLLSALPPPPPHDSSDIEMTGGSMETLNPLAQGGGPK